MEIDLLNISIDSFGRVILSDEDLRNAEEDIFLTSSGGVVNWQVCTGSNGGCQNVSTCSSSSNSWCANQGTCSLTRNDTCSNPETMPDI